MLDLFKKMFSGSSVDLSTYLEQGAYLADVRTPSEFALGSVPGAVNIPLDQINENILKLKNKKSIIVFCRSGNRSGQAQSILQNKGIANVINGGTWQNVKAAVDEKSAK